jgi:hypothetical protein
MNFSNACATFKNGRMNAKQSKHSYEKAGKE